MNGTTKIERITTTKQEAAAESARLRRLIREIAFDMEADEKQQAAEVIAIATRMMAAEDSVTSLNAMNAKQEELIRRNENARHLLRDALRESRANVDMLTERIEQSRGDVEAAAKETERVRHQLQGEVFAHRQEAAAMLAELKEAHCEAARLRRDLAAAKRDVDYFRAITSQKITEAHLWRVDAERSAERIEQFQAAAAQVPFDEAAAV